MVYSDENLHNSPLFSTLCENENYFGAQVSVLFLLNPSVQIAKKKVFDQTFYFKVLATAAFLERDKFYQNTELAITVRSIYDCAIFSSALKKMHKISENEHNILTSLNKSVECGHAHAHSFIYLKTPADIAFQRVSRRVQAADEFLNLDYLEKLSDAYDVFFSELSPYQKISFETEQIDQSELTDQISRFINQIFVPFSPYYAPY